MPLVLINDIPLFIRQIATGTADAAAKTILTQNILGGMCARVCPTETLCEEACVREAAEGKPVEIGRLQRYAVAVTVHARTTESSDGLQSTAGPSSSNDDRPGTHSSEASWLLTSNASLEGRLALRAATGRAQSRCSNFWLSRIGFLSLLDL